jgi:lipoprotein-anchoring transpeptidase ErfK/SrfK
MASGRFTLGLVFGAGMLVSTGTAMAADAAAPQAAPIKIAAASVEGATAVRSTPAAKAGKPVKVAATAAPAVGKAAKPKTVFKKRAKKAVYPTLKISIDLTRQRMTVQENGETKYTWAISSGRKGYRTPTGHYSPKWMTKMHYSRKYDNAPMPHSIFFHGGYAIHATYATGALGRPASHGCIRLSPANAKRLFKLVQKHKRARTRIAIHGVAKDRPVVARKKKTQRRSYAASRRAAPRQRAVQRNTNRRKTYSYSQPSYRRTWPGDAPRRLRY